jgi:hypothetical protein
MKPLFLSIFIIILSLTAQAQNATDYIINKNGDTVKCVISAPFLGEAQYTLPDGSTQLLEDTTQVKEYYFAKKRLQKRAVMLPGNKKPQYLEVVEDGKINIYFKQYTNGSLAWHIFKKTNSLSDITEFPLSSNTNISSAKADILKLVSDNKQACDMCNAKKKLSYDDVRDIIHFYNTGEMPKKDMAHKTDDMY